MALRFNLFQRYAIKLRLRRWLPPALCAIPYLASIFWLLNFSQTWIALIMLVPAVLVFIIGALTMLLARLEFQGRLRG